MMDKPTGEMTHEVKPEQIAEEAPQWRPTVTLEISKDQMEMLEVGNVVRFNILGKVKGVRECEMGKDSEAPKYDINLELQEVSIKPEENEFTRMAEDED